MIDDLMCPQIGAGTAEYEWMTWQEIAEEARRDTPVVISVGATEQHGPHLPVSADWAIPQGLLRLAVAKRHFVAGPALRLGYRSRPGSGGGQHFPATLSLRATTLMAVLEDVLNELVRTGFTRIMVYNWHFENAGFVYEPAFLVSERHPQVKIVVVEQGLPQFSEEDLAELFPEGFPGFELEHASLIETSLFQYLRPGAVREDLIRDDAPLRHPPYDVVPIDTTMSTPSGVLASPSGSSAAKGKLIADRISEYILGILDTEFPVAADSGAQDAQVTQGAAR